MPWMKSEKGATNEEREGGVMEAFGRRTQIHGIHYVLMPHYSKFRRILWAILCILFALLLIWSMAAMIQRYLSYPKRRIVEEIDNATMALPVVAICPLNQANLTSLTYIGQLRTTSGEEYGNNLPDHAGPQLNDVLISCKFQGKDCRKDFYRTLTPKGFCFQYNTSSPQIFTGKAGGLHLMINTESYDVPYEFGGETGLEVFLEKPSMFSEGVEVGPGIRTLMKLSHKKTRSLPPPFGNCGLIASHSDCVDNCVLNKMKQTCGCRPFVYTGGSGQGHCRTDEERDCLTLVAEKRTLNGVCDCPRPCFHKQWMVESSISMLSEHSLNREISLAVKASIMDAFNAAKASGAPHAPKPTDTLILKDTMAAVHLYYPEFSYIQVTQEVEYPTAFIIRDIAIHLLIFFGTSILALFEIIDFIIVAIVKCCRS